MKLGLLSSGLRVSPNLQLLVTLGYLASGSYQLSMGDCNDMSQPTASKCICKVSAAIAELAPDFIKFPEPEEEEKIMQQFSSIAGMPGVIGCIDGTHVPIKSPGGDDADLFRCRSNFFSLNVMGVCDTSMRFTQLVVDWPGGYRDWDVFSGSRLFEKLESGAYQGHLLGDNNYPCRSYLLTPFPAPCSEKEGHYNTTHASTRNLMERTFALWKKRFAVLSTPVRTKLLTTKNIITACGVLHNMAINNGLFFDEPEIGEEDPLEEPEQLEVEDRQEGPYRRADVVRQYF